MKIAIVICQLDGPGRRFLRSLVQLGGIPFPHPFDGVRKELHLGIANAVASPIALARKAATVLKRESVSRSSLGLLQ